MAPDDAENKRGRAKINPDRALRAVARFVPPSLWTALVMQEDGGVRVHFEQPAARRSAVVDGRPARSRWRGKDNPDSTFVKIYVKTATLCFGSQEKRVALTTRS